MQASLLSDQLFLLQGLNAALREPMAVRLVRVFVLPDSSSPWSSVVSN